MSRRSSILAFLFVMCAPSFALNATEAGYAPTAASCAITPLAGSTTGAGYANGVGSAARFSAPTGVAVDAAGNAYIADSDNHVIRKIAPGGTVTVFAGTLGVRGSADGTGTAASFDSPYGIVINGTVAYITDSGNGTIRKMTLTGVVTTLAGTAGWRGITDATGSAARFSYPRGITVDSSGMIYVTEFYACVIRRVSASGVVTTLAGKPYSCGQVDGTGFDPATGSVARFRSPLGIVALNGDLYVADRNAYTIRKVTSQNVVSTFAGVDGEWGDWNGQGTAARFGGPSGLALSASGDIYVSDWTWIRRIDAAGNVTPFAGGVWGSADGSGTAGQFGDEKGLAFDSAGNLWVADVRNDTVRKVTPFAEVTTVAGTAGTWGSTDGTGVGALLNGPAGIAADPSGAFFFTQGEGIRKVTAAGVVTTIAGSSRGSADGDLATAKFSYPAGLAVDTAGTIYVADLYNNTIRKISGGFVTTIAGTAGTSGSADGTGSAARFSRPYDVAVDFAGNLYVADSNNNTIRKVTPGGVVSTFAGQPGVWNHIDGPGVSAAFRSPVALAVDAGGYVYVADQSNYVVRKITPGGVVSTFAGSVRVSGVVDGTGTNARFGPLNGIAVDRAGNVYVSDSGTLRKITRDGTVSTVLGMPGSPGNVNGIGSAARLGDRFRIATTGDGKLVIADASNSAIRVAAFAASAGDVNGDGVVNAADVFHLVNVLYAGWPETAGSDVDGDGFVTIADVFYLINYLFGNGPAPGLVSSEPANIHQEIPTDTTEGE